MQRPPQAERIEGFASKCSAYDAALMANALIAEGNQAGANLLLDTYSRLDDYASLSSKHRQGRLHSFGWFKCGLNWVQLS